MLIRFLQLALAFSKKRLGGFQPSFQSVIMPFRGVMQEEEIFHNGDDFYERVFMELAASRDSILLEIHYLDSQILGRRLVRSLIQALDRQVTVKMIIDGFSPSTPFLKVCFKLLQRKGAQIAFFNPLPRHQKGLKGLLRMNQRNHKKVILIDQKTAFLGSINFDTRQLGHKAGGEGWREIGLALKGNDLKTIKMGFEDSWSFCQKKEVSIHILEDNARIRLNHHSFLRKKYFNQLIEKILAAKTRIWITNPYFVPDERMIDAFKMAKKRGVDIKILVPQRSDMHFFPMINSLFYRDLLKQEIHVYEYLPAILHAKIMIIDDWMMLGSSNLNTRTQKHDWEIDAVIKTQVAKGQLVERFARDIHHSKKLNYSLVCRRFQSQRFSFPLFKAIKYFL